ncbi:disease resistance protein Roq1-like [Cryptomeria japonica]|uniref:disease resistance protein Roq1-like n=1 Tax=Cryptomeria japonica TaxID=3369 RepID=UPI0027D9D8B6|nr:disease resistance protein Roq1-like [Cryptomeria japonica]
MAKRAIQSRSRYHEYMPPTTGLAFQTDKRYHVFLSFRGPDVRNTLVAHLYQALSAAGLNVFLDSDKLEKGEVIELSLETVIERSAIRIPIFSTGYANSAWCLKEAASMLKYPGLIIPLFYAVDPVDVRYPSKNSSPYKQSFLKHYSHSDQYPREEIEWWKSVLQHICPCLNFGGHSVRYPRREIDSWKDALQEISSRSGWSMDITQGVTLEVAKHPVGLDSVKNALIQKLNLNSVDDVIKIGIWGIGGIGKTTVAKALYNQVYMEFEAVSFVFNISATAADETGQIFVQRSFERKTRTLVLDDVDAMVQLDALAEDWLVPGSRVIITSRDMNILNVANISSECIHEMSGLETNEALQLFSWHAFLRAPPIPGYEDLSRRVVEACKGHPLTLEVIGSFLYRRKDTSCWIEALNNITLNNITSYTSIFT